MREDARVYVLVPDHERILSRLKAVADHFKINIHPFPLEPLPESSIYLRLKCKGFLEGMKLLAADDLIYFVDADTYCNKPLNINANIKKQILSGKVGFVPDIKDRHSRNPLKAWYLEPHKRVRYVNSGVILASVRSLDVFETFHRLSINPAFIGGPFHDQLIINFALGAFFNERLVLLEKRFNNMESKYHHNTIIGHCAGGFGGYEHSGRYREHERICSGIIHNRTNPKTGIEKLGAVN
jgi:hypothetical protein